MSERPSVVPEIDDLQEREAYDIWLRAKIAAVLANMAGEPAVPHETVMSEARQRIAEARARK